MLSLELTQLLAQIYYPFMRCTGLLLYVPIFSSFLIPMRIRLMLAVVIAYLVSHIIPPVDIVIFSAAGVFAAATQILIGFIFAFVMQLAYQAVSIAGETISMTMGLAFAQVVDPSNGHSVPLLSQLFLVFITLYYIAIDMHLVVLQVFAFSFYAIPVTALFNLYILNDIAMATSILFVAALLIAMPILATLLSINIAMGVMSRSAPQLNIFNVGFPMSIFLGYVAILFFIQEILFTFENLLQQQLDFFIDQATGLVS